MVNDDAQEMHMFNTEGVTSICIFHPLIFCAILLSWISIWSAPKFIKYYGYFVLTKVIGSETCCKNTYIHTII